MAYSDFSLAQLKKQFALTLSESNDLFSSVPDADLPAGLAEALRRNIGLAINLNTEKARSEFLIAPLLLEFKFLHRQRVGLFSGIEFNVDEAKGLNGRCDYILSRNPEQLYLMAPLCVLVEAKNEDMVAGVPQCLAEMLAAHQFNAQQGEKPAPVYGAVTTGVLWRFLKLEGTSAAIDNIEYHIQSSRKIFGILTHIAGV